MFKLGDKVRVNPMYTFFTTFEEEMVVTERTEYSGGIYYRTDKPCPVHGPYYNDFELEAIEHA